LLPAVQFIFSTSDTDHPKMKSSTLPSLPDGTLYNSVYLHNEHVTEVNRLFWILKILVRKLPVALISPTSQVFVPHLGHTYFIGLFILCHFLDYPVLTSICPIYEEPGREYTQSARLCCEIHRQPISKLL
jgi:hypothetical protein